MGRTIRHGGLYPSWNLRLFRRGKARYEERAVHEQGVIDERARRKRRRSRLRRGTPAIPRSDQRDARSLGSDQGSVVATNPALAFFGVQRPSEAAKLQDAFHLSPHQRTFLESAHRGDFLLSAGADRLAVRVKAPPWQEEVMRLARTAA